ncbi:16S rRNA (guanine(527)-N(7))-methyltransferase RsmG [Aquabacterium sp.]|uniref:16S rRNA (guanine(527)-N(7))-methyltransferase RsmG n=1 Tax=Aquabacterium sp. TaxID=1872578 RepID=UPI0019CBD94A|nr:16S rRNA (guanine(527)-N(7))-methyltransferase RsmG [Aquabacterium sp.]MBC7701303.1 16S rRNA (guanine(527)-N(7))-methyltransferase RsmG [Aquabacterium sp.]
MSNIRPSSSASASTDLAAELRRALEGLDLGAAPELSDHQIDQLLAYVAMLGQWGKTYNLTAVRDPAEMLSLHLLDSLVVLAPLWQHLQGQPAAMLDVGSGGGLPGVVLAITMPQLEVVCVDAVAKKAAFVRQVAAELRLPNLKAEHARVEDLRPKPWPVITSRAFASLHDFVALTQNLLAPQGVWMAMKGKHPADEIAALPEGVEVFHVEQLQVPGLEAERCLVWMRQQQG